MGTWGVKIYQDDLALDIKDEYKYLLEKGKTNEEAIKEMLETFEGEIEDADEGAMFWIVFADVLWNYGRLTEEIKKKAIEEIESGRDLIKWKQEVSIKVYEQRKREIEKVKEKLNTQQPEEKRIPKHRLYKCEWKNGDVFAYKLESEYAKEKGLHNQYLIMQKAGELEWPPGHIIPMVRVKITKDNNIPKTEEEVNKLEYIETSYCEYENRFDGFSATEPIEEQIGGRTFETDEYGLLPEFLVTIINTSKKGFEDKMIYIGNYPNISLPAKEFIPLHELNIKTVFWKEFEKEMIEAYFGNNKRQYEFYKK